MPESLTFRFINGGGGDAAPSGGSPTASQFGRRDEPAAPTAPGRTTSDRIEDRQSREPARAEQPPIPRVDEPTAPVAPKTPTVVPPAPATPVVPTAPAQVPPAQPTVPGQPPVPTTPQQQQLAALSTARGASTAGILAAAGSSAALPFAVAGIAVQKAIKTTAKAVNVVDAALSAAAEAAAPFSPDIAQGRAQARVAGIRQQQDIASRIGEELAIFESVKAKAGRLGKDAVAGAVELASGTRDISLDVVSSLAEAIAGQGKEVRKALNKLDQTFLDFIEHSKGVETIFNRPHLPVPDFDGDIIRSGGSPENAPTGLEFK